MYVADRDTSHDTFCGLCGRLSDINTSGKCEDCEKGFCHRCGVATLNADELSLNFRCSACEREIFFKPISDGTHRTIDEAAAELELPSVQLWHILKALELDTDASITTDWIIHQTRGLTFAIVDTTQRP